MLQHLNPRVPEGEEEEQEIENLFEKIMKEKVTDPAKEIDFQEVQEAQRVPKKLDPRKHTPRHIIIKLPKIKDKKRILKAAETRRQLPTKEFPLDYQLISQKQTNKKKTKNKKPLQAKRSWKEVFEVMKGKDLHPDYSIQQSYHLK